MTSHSDAPAEASAAPVVRRMTRPFYWSLRRELWENRSVYMAPLIAAAVVLFGYVISLAHPPHVQFTHRGASASAVAFQQFMSSPATHYLFGMAVIVMAGLGVGVFYCAGALHGERRDRTILFWKSLPVSDLTTVLSKATVPLAVIPLVSFAICIVTALIMLSFGAAFAMSRSQDPAVLWTAVDLAHNSLMVLYSLVVTALWQAPVWAWLLLVSGWAKRVPFVWAVGIPVAPCIVERIGLGTSNLGDLLGSRLVGGLKHAFTAEPKARVTIDALHMDPIKFLTSPDVWIGLAFAAAFLAAAVWQRRRREPV